MMLSVLLAMAAASLLGAAAGRSVLVAMGPAVSLAGAYRLCTSYGMELAPFSRDEHREIFAVMQQDAIQTAWMAPSHRTRGRPHDGVRLGIICEAADESFLLTHQSVALSSPLSDAAHPTICRHWGSKRIQQDERIQQDGRSKKKRHSKRTEGGPVRGGAFEYRGRAHVLRVNGEAVDLRTDPRRRELEQLVRELEDASGDRGRPSTRHHCKEGRRRSRERRSRGQGDGRRAERAPASPRSSSSEGYLFADFDDADARDSRVRPSKRGRARHA